MMIFRNIDTLAQKRPIIPVSAYADIKQTFSEIKSYKDGPAYVIRDFFHRFRSLIDGEGLAVTE
jgi:hypothetical protein